jgi:hypothetical protein
MPINSNLLKALLIEHGDTAQDYANVLNCGITTAYSRLNGVTEHSQIELKAVKKHYNLSDERFLSIFFA